MFPDSSVLEYSDSLAFTLKRGRDKTWGRPWPRPWGGPWGRPWPTPGFVPTPLKGYSYS